MMMLLCMFTVQGLTFEESYNLTDLPAYGTFSYNFSLAQNEEIFVSLLQDEGNVTLEYPAVIQFGNDTQKQLDINYSLAFFSEYEGNETLFEEILEVSNSVNNNTELIIMQFTVEHESLFNLTNSFLGVSDDGKKVEIRTFSVIEFNETHYIPIEAPEDTSVSVLCTGQFITCPRIVNTSTTSTKVNVPVEIHIPKDTQEGAYSGGVNISLGTKSGYIEFDFIIEYRDDLYRIIQYDVWDESCYDSTERLAQCYKEQARYNAEIANKLLERTAQECGEDNETKQNIIINETIKYVEVGNIDPELFNKYENLNEQFTQLAQVYGETVTEYDECLAKNKELADEVTRETKLLGEEVLLKKSQLQDDYEEKELELKSSLITKSQTVLMYLCIALFSFIFIGAWLKQRWIINEYHPKLLWLLLLIFAGMWVYLQYFWG